MAVKNTSLPAPEGCIETVVERAKAAAGGREPGKETRFIGDGLCLVCVNNISLCGVLLTLTVMDDDVLSDKSKI